MTGLFINGTSWDVLAQYRFYRDKVSDLQRMKLDDQRELACELIIFLGDWLLHHILEEDKQYAN